MYYGGRSAIELKLGHCEEASSIIVRTTSRNGISQFNDTNHKN